jgi:hypothetical protein
MTFNVSLKYHLVFAYYFVMPLYYSSKDILMRVVAQNLSPELTLVEKVYCENPIICLLITFALCGWQTLSSKSC